jgi:hypothetical protein
VTSINARQHKHTVEEEAEIREAALDRTIEDSFPASDPPSSIPNPYDDRHDLRGHVDEEREDPANEKGLLAPSPRFPDLFVMNRRVPSLHPAAVTSLAEGWPEARR